MLTPLSQGKVIVPVAGTPVQIAASAAPVRSLRFSVVAGNTGRIFLGCSGLNASTGAGLIKEFAANPTGGVDDTLTLPSLERETYNPTDYWIDAAVSGEGLIVSLGSSPS
jgi:hypothetical protein